MKLKTAILSFSAAAFLAFFAIKIQKTNKCGKIFSRNLALITPLLNAGSVVEDVLKNRSLNSEDRKKFESNLLHYSYLRITQNPSQLKNGWKFYGNQVAEYLQSSEDLIYNSEAFRSAQLKEKTEVSQDDLKMLWESNKKYFNEHFYSMDGCD